MVEYKGGEGWCHSVQYIGYGKVTIRVLSQRKVFTVSSVWCQEVHACLVTGCVVAHTIWVHYLRGLIVLSGSFKLNGLNCMLIMSKTLGLVLLLNVLVHIIQILDLCFDFRVHHCICADDTMT